MCAPPSQDEGEEEETDNLVNQVLDEIGIGNMTEVGVLGWGSGRGWGSGAQAGLGRPWQGRGLGGGRA